MMGFCRFFAKKSIMYVPGIGQGIYLLGFVFLSRNWNADAEKINKTFESLRNLNVPFWLISHLEGTRFSPKKVANSQQFAKKHDLPLLNHVLLPRYKGFVATLKGLRTDPKVKAVYDFTVVYNDGNSVPHVASMLLSKLLMKPGKENDFIFFLFAGARLILRMEEPKIFEK